MARGRSALVWAKGAEGNVRAPRYLERRTGRAVSLASFQPGRRLFRSLGRRSVKIKAAVVTISDKGYVGERRDVSGPLLTDLLEAMGARVVHRGIVPDELELITRTLRELADVRGVDLIVTTGGTGPAPRDRTPEATREVIEREIPGLTEILRVEGYKKTPLAVISRGVAGIRGSCLIVNLPGNPKAVRESMEILAPILPHTIQMIQGINLEHGSEEHETAASR